jgi:hypothetical protein
MGGRNRPESVAGINRNGWPASSGIAGRNRPEYAIGSHNVVQSIAKQALGIPDSAKLEESTKAANILIQLNETIDIGIKPVLFKLKMA